MARFPAERQQNGSTSTGRAGLLPAAGHPPLLGRTFEERDHSAASRVVVIGQRLWQQRFGQRLEDPAPPLTEDQVIPGYFEAIRIPLVRGRLLQESDLAQGAPPVIVIIEEMARRFWPGQDPVGKRLKYGLDPAANSPWKTVVGVVADMRRQRLDEPAIPYMFQPGINRQMDIAVRTINDPELSREAIRAEMRALDPTVPPYGILTVEQRLGRTVALRKLQTLLLVALAGVALVLSVIGAYSVMHQSVAARMREIGVRMALGANASDMRRMVLTDGLAPALAGLVLGLLGSLALSRTMSVLVRDRCDRPDDLRPSDHPAAVGHHCGLPGACGARRPLGSDDRTAARVTH